jgi:hypothetical protein
MLVVAVIQVACSQERADVPARAPEKSAVIPEPAETLELRELLEPGPVLKPSVRTTALAGRRVRMVGFMAQMELPPKGGFYLVPRPVRCDEAGGGTADLPPDNVLVMARSAAGETISFMDGALEVTGVLEVGNRADADGRVSAIRLLLDGPPGEKVRSARAETK